MKARFFHPFILGFAAMVLVATASASAFAKSAPESFADLADSLLPAVVNISTTQVIEQTDAPEMPQFPPGSPFEDFFKDFFDKNAPGQRARKATSLGSGFIVDSNGNNESYVVTNNHVIQDADEVSVILQDNTRLDAEIVGRDPKTDLAVLKIKSDRRLPSVKFGDSDAARVGDWVLAIGNPFGLGGTVTAGIVSARGRDIRSGPYDNFIQTDASINRGNSGGPMFNMAGEVVGINTAIFSPSGGSIGIGFAIPSSTASGVVKQLIKHGQVQRGWLGVHIQNVTDEIAETLGLDEARGALVSNVVEGGPAEDAKIQPGDVILSFAGQDVPEMRKLPRIVAATSVGDRVDVVLWRKGKKLTVKVKVGRLDDAEEARAEVEPKKDGATDGNGKVTTVDALGLKLAALSAEVRKRFEIPGDAKGVLVTDVAGNSNAAENGIRPGDLIVEVSQKEVSSPAEVTKAVAAAQKDGRKSILLLVEGQAGLRFVALKLEKK